MYGFVNEHFMNSKNFLNGCDPGPMDKPTQGYSNLKATHNISSPQSKICQTLIPHGKTWDFFATVAETPK